MIFGSNESELLILMDLKYVNEKNISLKIISQNFW